MRPDEIIASNVETHGDFSTTAQIAQALKRIARACAGWEKLRDEQKESLDLQHTKQARILSGDPEHANHWDDIAGYALLGLIKTPQLPDVTDAKSARPFVAGMPAAIKREP